MPTDAATAETKKPVKILIVEDDIQIQQMYATMFKLKNVEVVVAIDGVEGLEKARSERPDAILLDIMMPRMNGIEMLERIKREPITQEIPVIMLSNITEEEEIKDALSKGAVKYIIKSEYIPRQVFEMVLDVLSDMKNGSLPTGPQSA